MRVPAKLRTWALLWAGAFAVWTVLAYVYALQEVRYTLVMQNRHIGVWSVLRRALETYSIFALLTPLVIQYVRRFAFPRGRPARSRIQRPA